MTEGQFQVIVNAIRNAHYQITETLKKHNSKETTEYQPCPICNGNGWVFPTGNSSATTTTCHYCNGSKTVIKSITK